MNPIFERAKTFLWNNGRLLERQLFAFVFEHGSRDAVLSSLRAYQNADGGFGNALEPDKRTSSSQPIDQEIALRVLDMVGFDHTLATPMCAWLETVTTTEGGIPFVLPSVADAPRAPWWNTEPNPRASINPTASIAGFLHKHHGGHPWLDRATAFCWQTLESSNELTGHDVLASLIFLQHVPDRARANDAFKRVGELLFAQKLVELDPLAEGYVHKPLDFAPTPDSMARILFDNATIDQHLNHLMSQQQPDGGWNITWDAISPACELEYRGMITLNALRTLQAYGQLQQSA